MNNIYGFILASLAGATTMLGTFLLFIRIKNKEKIISFSLSFAAGVMLTVSVTDLLPESTSFILENLFTIPSYLLVIFSFVVGIIISMTIDDFLPNNNEHNNSKLYRIGVLAMFVIILHNLPEGMITFLATTNNPNLGLKLALAISLHNIPEGISICIPIYHSTKSKKKAILYTLISALSEPLGALLAYIILAPFLNSFILGIILGIIAGMMSHIAIYELLPESLSYNKKLNTLISFISGVGVMLLAHFTL